MVVKGQMYSLMAMMMIIPLALFIVFFISNVQEMKPGISERIVADQIYRVERNIERDFGRAAGISCSRALLAEASDVVTKGVYMDDAVSGLMELMLNGTLNGTQAFHMVNNTLDDWRDAMLGLETGFNINLDYSNLSIQNHNGFSTTVAVTLTVNVSDRLGIARIDRNVLKEGISSIEGMDDPIFPLNTQKHIRRSVRVYHYPYYTKKIVTGTPSGNCSGNVSFSPGSPDPEKILVTHNGSGISGFRGVVSETPDMPGVACYIVSAGSAVSLINSTITESGYPLVYLDEPTSAAWSLPLAVGVTEGLYYPEGGPDILMRLEGNMTAVPEGLESFVSIPDLEAEGIPTKPNQTLVDYLYFPEQVYTGSAARGFPEWFRIDSNHAATYNLTELLES